MTGLAPPFLADRAPTDDVLDPLLSRPAAAAVLAAAVGWVILLQIVALHPTPIPDPPRADGAGDSHGDLALYRAVVARVGTGEDYYAVLGDELSARGYPTRSVFNWRLPTYAWLLAGLGPGGTLVLGTLVTGAAIVLSARAVLRQAGAAATVVFVTIQLGVVTGPLTPVGRYLTEVWAATLLLAAAGAAGCGYRWAAVAAGLAALFVRELAAVYVVVAVLDAARGRRWREVAAWAVGLGGYALYFAWHLARVAEHRPPHGVDGGGWLAFGGLAFDVTCTRMNAYLLDSPEWVVALYLAVAVTGLLAAAAGAFRVPALATVGYLTAFAVIGRPFNFYWGFVPAPLLVFGVVSAPAFWGGLIVAARGAAGPRGARPAAGPP